MRKKKVLVKDELSDVIFKNHKITISKFKDNWMFEIEGKITNDPAEAVSILMKNKDIDNSVWEISTKDISIEKIVPEKSLFWLTGGYSDWESLEFYKKPWHDCYLSFQEEFGLTIIEIVKNSKNFGEIKEGFNKYLNLPILWDFAIGKNLVV